MPFFIIFVCIPLAEIIVFMSVSDKIGLGTALLMALFTAVLGGFLVKYQGLRTLFSAQESMKHGAIPSKELFDGLCLVAAGATLITPGFITDALGFLLLVPAFRNVLRQKIGQSAHFKTTQFHTEFTDFQDHSQHDNYSQNKNDVIDVEYETLDHDDKA